MTAKTTPSVHVFYSFARQDEGLRGELEKHLSNFQRLNQITGWHASMIDPGKAWEDEIETHLNAAHLILLLVSPDFLASDQCYVEMTKALARHEANQAVVYPILLRPLHYENAPFSALPILPSNGKPVTKWSDPDEAFLSVAESLQLVINGLLALQWFQIGCACQQAEIYEEALDAYERAISFSMQGELGFLYRNKGFALLQLGRFDEALVAFNKAIQLDHRDLAAYLGKNNALAWLGRHEEMLASLDCVIRLDPASAPSYILKCDVLRVLERHEEALLACEQAINLDSNTARAFILKGDILRKLKRYEAALASYERAEQLAPGSEIATREKEWTLFLLKREAQ